MPRMPWMKFWPADWLSEPRLRLVSRAARSLWVDLLCVMHTLPERGVMRHDNGTPMTDIEIIQTVGGDSDMALLAELETRGVCSRTKDGALYCRRMVRETHIGAVRSEAGRRGAAKTNRLPGCLPKDLPGHLPQQKVRQNVASSILPLASASQGIVDDVDVEAGEAQRREECAQWLTRRPEWLSEEAGWITLTEARKAIQRRPSLTLPEVQGIYSDAKRSRRSLRNPAGYVLMRLKEAGT